MARALVSASPHLCFSDVNARRSSPICALPLPTVPPTASSFVRGSPLSIRGASNQMKSVLKARSVTIRCEQSTKSSGSLDVWLGRFAMVGFAVAITVEISTGKGLLENFGLTSPLPTVALGVTALVGVLTAIFIFQSASKD
ncbi:hypothetical protein Scep_020186 [Stephania cephalantha]|uniref:Stress enhanced protein 1 n=1 Tax=Stephania cephalantha TaxID=152367 RepID=A0AAP0ICQ2_9MAGN